MTGALKLIGLVAAIVPAAALGCSCDDPAALSIGQMRAQAKHWSLVAYGRITQVHLPTGCRVAPVRWAHTVLGSRLPMTFHVKVTRTLWGRPLQTVSVVQRQIATWSGCVPLGSAACEAPLPGGDTLWVLSHTPTGELRHGGLCGVRLAARLLRL